MSVATATLAAPPSAPALVETGTRSTSFQTLDAARGLACLWVVIFHAASLIAVKHPEIHAWPIAPFLFAGFAGVHVFFVVSGYCIASAAASRLAKPNPAGSFLYARFRRILPPCWFSLVLYALAATLAEATAKHNLRDVGTLASLHLWQQSPRYFVANLTLTQLFFGEPFLSVVCWTLCYEVAFYVIVAVVLLVVSRLLAPGRRLAVMLMSLHVLTLLTSLPLLSAALPQFAYPFDLWPSFGLGVLVYDILQNKRRPAKYMLAAVVGVLMASMLFLDRPLGYTRESSRLLLSSALAATGLFLVLYPRDGILMSFRPMRWIVGLGGFSYSLYLVNLLVIPAALSLLLPAVPRTLHMILTLVSATAAAVVGGYLFYLVCERPFLSSRRKRNASPERTPS